MTKLPKSDYPGTFPPPYYFIKTVVEAGRLRAKPLPMQFYPNPSDPDMLLEYRVDWNVSCDKAGRQKYPEGTVFAVNSLDIQMGHYSTPVGLWAIDYLNDFSLDSATSMGITSAYNDYTRKSAQIKSLLSKAGSETGSPSRATSFLGRLKAKSSYACPTIEDDGYYIEEDKWFYLVRNIRKKIPTLLTGPTGTAKTKAAFLLAKKLGLDLSVHDMGSMQDAISGLLGVHRLVDGNSVFDLAPFALDIQKSGILLLDELSRAPAGSNNILFPCLDDRKKLPLAFASSDQDREIDVGSRLSFLATANIGSEYTGTQELDLALSSRFEIIELPYLSPEIESRLLVKMTGVDKTSADKIAGVADAIRNEFNRGALSCGISTRETLSVASLIHDGFYITTAFEFVFLPLFAGSLSIPESERATVYNFILSAV